MIINRYLTREVFGALSAVTLVLVVALLCQQMVRYLNYAAIGKIPTNVLMLLVGFEVPYLLAMLLPLGLCLGIILAYGRLYADNEMAILQLCGFNYQRLLRITIKIALSAAIFVLILMLWINPLVSAKRLEVMSGDEATLHLVQTLIPGRFQVSPDGQHVMYVEKMSRDRQRAENVFMAQETSNPDHPEQSAWMLVFADQGYQTRDHESQELFFVTTNGYRYEGIPGQNDYKITQFSKYAVRIPQETRVTHQEDEALSLKQLWHDYANPKRAAELQWRFSLGIATFLLALLGVSLSVVRPRRGRYLALLPAVLAYVVYINFLFIVRHWVEQGIVPVFIGMWWVHGVMLILILITAAINDRIQAKS